MSFSFESMVIVDVETTGSRTQNGRIIEIGILRIEDGKLVKSFGTLINPQQQIPLNITMLTGISNEDVVDAPTFNEISEELKIALDGCLFVAHNALFDYGFVKHEFKRMGTEFNAQTMCSVKLSRKLFPEHQHHNLGIIIERYNLCTQARHRALDDAKVVWDFLQIIKIQVEPKKLNDTWLQLTRKPVLPNNLNIKSFDEIPEEAGIYIFYDNDNKPLYIGRAHHMREKIMTYFENLPEDGKRAVMMRRLRRIEFRMMVGDLSARLLQQYLVKTLKPSFNFALRIPREQLKPIRWPFNGAIAIEEKDVFGKMSNIFCINDWILHKAVSMQGDDMTIFFPCDAVFDPTIIKTLHNYIKSNPDLVKRIDLNKIFRR